MKKYTLLLLVFTIYSCQVFAQKTTVTESKELSFSPQSKNHTLLISNLKGAVEVESYDGNTVQVEMKKMIDAKNKSDYDRALTEVKTKFETIGDTIVVKFDPPCTPYNGNSWGSWSKDGNYRYTWSSCIWEPNYDFKIDYKVKVPRQVNLKINTKDDGDVVIKNINGNVEAWNHHGNTILENVKGEIYARTHHGELHLKNVAGEVEARTHHKDINVTYAEAPKDGSFKTHHGDINVSYKSELAAKMRFKSRHGDFFTNIEDVKVLPDHIKEDRKDKGGVSYKIGSTSAVQARNGNVLLDFKTYHGNVTVKEKS